MLVGPPPSESVKSTIEPQVESAVDEHRIQWKEVIDAEVLTSEVKRIKNRITAIVARPAGFKAGAHADCRRELTMLAVIFDVIEEYPDELSWRESAHFLKGACMQAADASREGTAKGLSQVREMLFYLEDLLGGQSVAANEAAGEEGVAELPPLMQQMEFMLKQELPPLVMTKTVFRKNLRSVDHMGQLFAALSSVIGREEYGYADDGTYQSHAHRLREAGELLKAAAAGEDFAKAVEAAAGISRACADCHLDYRG